MRQLATVLDEVRRCISTLGPLVLVDLDFLNQVSCKDILCVVTFMMHDVHAIIDTRFVDSDKAQLSFNSLQNNRDDEQSAD